MRKIKNNNKNTIGIISSGIIPFHRIEYNINRTYYGIGLQNYMWGSWVVSSIDSNVYIPVLFVNFLLFQQYEHLFTNLIVYIFLGSDNFEIDLFLDKNVVVDEIWKKK